MHHETRYLFVYGTLRRVSSHPMAQRLAEHARFAGAARAQGRLYDLGRYPGMTAAHGPDEWVHGDLYDLAGAAATLAELDAYEAIESPQPAFFERQAAAVTSDEGRPVQAWLYWWRGPVSEAQRIPSGDYFAREQAAKSLPPVC